MGLAAVTSLCWVFLVAPCPWHPVRAPHNSKQQALACPANISRRVVPFFDVLRRRRDIADVLLGCSVADVSTDGGSSWTPGVLPKTHSSSRLSTQFRADRRFIVWPLAQ